MFGRITERLAVVAPAPLQAQDLVQIEGDCSADPRSSLGLGFRSLGIWLIKEHPQGRHGSYARGIGIGSSAEEAGVDLLQKITTIDVAVVMCCALLCTKSCLTPEAQEPIAKNTKNPKKNRKNQP